MGSRMADGTVASKLDVPLNEIRFISIWKRSIVRIQKEQKVDTMMTYKSRRRKNYIVEVEKDTARILIPKRTGNSDPHSRKVTATAAPPAGSSATSETVTAPMNGLILSVNVKAGDIVRVGDILFILEAMKMENEIMAPRDGKIASVDVAQGTNVETGQRLLVME